MMNDRNKELLACNDKNWASLNKDAMDDNKGIGYFLLNAFTCMVKGESSGEIKDS